MNGFEQKILQSLQAAFCENGDAGGKNPQTPPLPTLLAAVSGGADSTAMLAGLAACREKLPFNLRAAHINHNLRGDESRADAEAAAALCARFSVPCHVETVPEGKIAALAKASGCGIEAAARDVRRAALRAEAARSAATHILPAHTRDDLLETFIMRLLRGCGPAGLAAMPATTRMEQTADSGQGAPLNEAEGGKSPVMLRPLLELSRADVEAYLIEKDIPWRTDSTNASDIYLRNKIRLRLIPVLDQYFPDWRQNFLSAAKTQRLAADFIAAEAEKRLPLNANFKRQPGVSGIDGVANEENHFFGESFDFKADIFFAEPEIIREEAIFKAFDALAALGTAAGISADYAGAGENPGSGNLEPDLPPRSAAPPRRETVRAFTQGQTPAACMGIVEVRRKNARSQSGGSLVIKESGIYKLGGLAIECVKGEGTQPEFSLVISC